MDIIYLKSATYSIANQGSGFRFNLPAKTLTFDVYGGSRATIIAESSYAVNVNTGVADASKIVRFKNLDFVITGNTTLYTLSSNKYLWVVFDNCTATDASGTSNYIVYIGPSDTVQSKLQFVNGCNITCRGYFYLNDLALFEISDSTITQHPTSSIDIIPFFKTITTFIFTNNKFNVPNGAMITMTNMNGYLGTTYLRITNNTGSVGKQFLRYDNSKICKNALIAGNVITSTTNNGHVVISIGTDYQNFTPWAISTAYVAGDLRTCRGLVVECLQNHTSSAADEPNNGTNWQQYWKVVDVGKFIISDNVIDSSGTTAAGYAILIGPGCRNATIINNKITVGTGSMAYGIVCKGTSSKIVGNVIVGPRPLYIWAASRDEIENNTVVATLGSALLMDGTTGQYPCGTIIRKNIFDGSLSSLALQISSGDNFHLTLLNDKNCYRGGSEGKIKIGNTLYTLATVKMMWQTSTTCYADNDQNSIEENPHIDHNYMCDPLSECARLGIGAVLPNLPRELLSKRSLRSRMCATRSDFGYTG